MAKETEVTLYAKIGDIQGLSKANAVETHYQWESQSRSNKYSRVRLTIKGDDKTIVYTTKVKRDAIDGLHSSEECECLVNQEFLNCFKNVADQLLIKDRFEFKCDKLTLNMVNGQEERLIELPEVVYEVDVFKTKSGEASEWCKIDIEVDTLEEYIKSKYPELGDYKLLLKVTNLPFKPSEVIFLPAATEVQKEFVQKLWSDVFVLKVTEGEI